MEVDEVMRALADGARSALGDDLLGLYLVGSHGLGAADEHSDVDFLAITADRLTPGQQAAVEGLHARLPDLPGRFASRLEGSYAPATDLRSPMTIGRGWPYVDQGSRAVVRSDHDNTVHGRWVLREHGLPIVGPPASTYVAALDAGALRAEMIGLARALAEDVEEHPERLAEAKHQHALVVTLCRILHTVHTATVASKMTAAAWAAEVVGTEHRLLVDRVLSERPDPWERVSRAADPGLAAPTRAFAWEVHRLVGAEALRQADS